MASNIKSKPWHMTLRYQEDGCRVTDNARNQDGYVRVGGGLFGRDGLIMLHVGLWQKEYGEKPEGMELNHKCGNRACCNLEHLELICGSHHAAITNSGRVGYIKNRLEPSEVEEVYTRCKYLGDSINSLCKEKGIKRSTVSSIINKRSRTSITDQVDINFKQQEETKI